MARLSANTGGQARTWKWTALNAALSDVLRQKPSSYLVDKCEAGIPAGPINMIDNVSATRRSSTSGSLHPCTYRSSALRGYRLWVSFSAHTDDVLQWFDYSRNDIDKMGARERRDLIF